ncbi:MAG: pyridoxal phosphate-dependent aminotransferase, partial [Candidatus Omnitrophica bacterium]|nr:pyridoxal phosphate-dependent aminotransferase [Candidatus Omnitrophota bacterium]
FFHYRHAISILGWDYNKVFKDGRLDLDPDKWADFGALNFHIGPPKNVTRYLRNRINFKNITYYSPDLVTPLRDAAAGILFKRSRGKEFEVVGTEGVQAAMAYAILTIINPGDEVIITDPGYFFFEPPIILAGGKTKRIILNRNNNYRIDVEDLKKKISRRTKMIIVCDPINPFGTVQTKQELIEIVKIANRRNIIVLNNITHSLHQIKPQIKHYPITSLYNVDLKNVIAVSGVAHGYGMAGIRIGFMAGHPRLLRPILLTKSVITRINISFLAQYAALAALKDRQYLKRCDAILRNNFSISKEIIRETPNLSFIIEPSFGFSACIDTSKIKTSCQELTVALLKRRCAVYPSDGLGNTGAISYIRINFSTPYKEHFRWLREALPEAIKEAETRKYRKAVIDFLKSVGTGRAKRLIKLIKGIGN